MKLVLILKIRQLISSLNVKVVWGAPGKTSEYLIGVEIAGISEDKRRQLLDAIKKMCSSSLT
jgi:hypothetical protein